MGLLRYCTTVFWAAFTALPRRWIRGPGHPTWSWRAEVLSVIARTAAHGVVGMPVTRLRAGLLGATRPAAFRKCVTHRTLEIAGRPAEEHTPKGWTPVRPTVLYLHGGGYIVGSPATHRDLITRLAWNTGCRCVALDYRLAPEAPYPAALEDTLGAVAELIAEEPQTALWLAGDSAGGGLSLATLIALRDRGLPQVSGALLLSPWVDLTPAGLDPSVDNDHDYLCSGLLQMCRDSYVGDADDQDPCISPATADLTGLPPLMIQAGGAEIFLPQIQALAERARTAGVEVVLEVGEGMVHVFQAFGLFLPEARDAIRSLGAFLRQHWSAQVEPKPRQVQVEPRQT